MARRGSITDDKIDATQIIARENSQKKTFTRWANHYLGERMLKIVDLYEDLKSGILLIQLMQIISNKSLGKYDTKPKMELQMLGNIDISLQFIKNQGITLVNIGPKDVYEGTPKLILGLLWTLIIRYQIQLGGDGSPKAELMEWVNKQIKPYEKKGVLQIVNFTSSLQDGKCLAALAYSVAADPSQCPELDMDHLGDATANCQSCLNVSQRDYNIPALLDTSDVVQAGGPDEHSAMTYISYFRDYLENKAKDGAQYKIKGANAQASYATGRGVGESGTGRAFRGRKQPFVIHSKSLANEYVVIAKWKCIYTVTVTDPQGCKIPCDVNDNQDGTYSCSYNPIAIGAHQVSIVQEGKYDIPDAHIKNSVHDVNVAEGSDASKSYAQGPGLTNAFDDVPAYFTVHCLDCNGKPVAGEDTLQVDITMLKKLENGGRPTAPAKTAPPTPTVKPFCEQCGAKKTGSKFCEECGFKFPLAAAAASSASGVKVATHTESTSVPIKIKDNNDGTYAVEYSASVAGDYELVVTVDQKKIRDMPSSLKVHKGIDASQSFAEGRGVSSPGFLGRKHPFIIHSVDRDGHPLQVGGGDFRANVAGPSGSVSCTLNDNGDGTYSGNYTPTALGRHVVDIKLAKTIGSEPIRQNPFIIEVKKGADLQNSYAEGEGVHDASDNRRAHFKVYAKDSDGKPVSGEWLSVKIIPKGGSLVGDSVYPVNIIDNGNGTYDVSYQADNAGDYTMNVLIDDKSIRDMPTNLHVHAGAVAAKCVVEGPGVEGGVVNRDLPFLVQAMDKNGQPLRHGGDIFQVNVNGPTGKVPCEIKDNGDGTYSGMYRPTIPGSYKLDLMLNDQADHVAKAPYTVRVRPAGDASKSYAKGKGWRYCYDNQPTSFTVYVHDVDGKPVTGEILGVTILDVTSAKYKQEIDSRIAQVDPYMLRKKEEQIAANRGASQASNTVPSTVEDNSDGTYTVRYTAFRAGELKINVEVSNASIKDAPKVIKCMWACPNAPCAHTTEELHQELAVAKDEIYALRKQLAQFKGQKFEDRGYEEDH